MYGSVLSALLIGMVPVWNGGNTYAAALLPPPSVSPPAGVVRALSEIDKEQRLSASGILVIDAQSGQQLYGRNARVTRPMASLTKLMTALLIIENHALDEWVTVPSSVSDVPGSRAYLEPGSRFLVKDLLKALLIMSANDAAVTLAQYDSGSVEAFVEKMNERAKELGLKDTVYSNPTGLDAFSQHSTPQDLAWLTMYVTRNEDLRDLMGMRGAVIVSADGKETQLYHTHALLHDNAEVIAGKTGTTDGAGECLVTLIQHAQKTYLVVLLRSSHRYDDMRAILKLLTA